MIGMSSPSCETMCTSTDDCFCHEQVRQSWSPNSLYAHWSSSSARMASKSLECTPGTGSILSPVLLDRGAVAKQDLLQGVGAKTAAERLERDHLVRRDVSEVDGRAELLHEPGLRDFGGRFEDDVIEVDHAADLRDQLRPHLALRREDPRAAALARFSDHLPCTRLELLAQPARPLVRREFDGGVLRADLREDGELARKLRDQLELLLARDLDRTVGDLDVRQPELAKPTLVLLHLPARPDCFEERAADDDSLLSEHLELAAQVRRHVGRAPAQLDHVDVVAARLEDVLPRPRPEPLVENVGQAAFARLKAELKGRQGSSPGASRPPRSRRGRASCRASRCRPRAARSR